MAESEVVPNFRSPTKNAPRRPPFILITVALDLIARPIVIPVLPTLMRDFPGASRTRRATWDGRRRLGSERQK
ncbi:MAG: hypothetical protein ABIR38_07215 [Chthoniobacterales bacterium]